MVPSTHAPAGIRRSPVGRRKSSRIHGTGTHLTQSDRHHAAGCQLTWQILADYTGTVLRGDNTRFPPCST